jgi:hypothetical protein
MTLLKNNEIKLPYGKSDMEGMYKFLPDESYSTDDDLSLCTSPLDTIGFFIAVLVKSK